MISCWNDKYSFHDGWSSVFIYIWVTFLVLDYNLEAGNTGKKCNGDETVIPGITSLRDCAYKCSSLPHAFFGYGNNCELEAANLKKTSHLFELEAICECVCYRDSEMTSGGPTCTRGTASSSTRNLYNFIDGEKLWKYLEIIRSIFMYDYV